MQAVTVTHRIDEGAHRLPMKKQASTSRLSTIVTGLIGLFFALILLVVVLGQARLSFAYTQESLLSNLALLPMVLAVLCVGVWLRARAAATLVRKHTWRWLVLAYFAALLAVQFVVTRSVWFYPGWDVLNVYTKAETIARGLKADGTYFCLCPNNAPITVLLSLPLWIGLQLGLAVPYGVLPYLGAWMVNLACLVGMLCVLRLTQSRFARLTALLLFTVWIAFSITATIPYTDAFAILWPVLAFYVYISGVRTPLKWFLISLICFFGASIKPTVLILELAMVLWGLVRVFPLRQWSKGRWKRLAAIGAAIVLGAIPGSVWQESSTAFLAGSAKPEQQLSATHYLMLGMNGATYGGHSAEDVAFSTSYVTLAERSQANLQKAWERLSSRSVTQNVAFFTVKAYKAFSDGMLASNRSYLVNDVPVRHDALSVFLRRILYTKGDLNPLLTTIEQGVWLGILLLCVAAMLGKARKKPITAVLALTLFGLAIYLLLFEVWPRYLFLYAPLFVTLAALGADGLAWPVRRKAVVQAPEA